MGGRLGLITKELEGLVHMGMDVTQISVKYDQV